MGKVLKDHESVDVYFSDLRQLAELSGGMTKEMLTAAFIRGLPKSVRAGLNAFNKFHPMTLKELKSLAREML